MTSTSNVIAEVESKHMLKKIVIPVVLLAGALVGPAAASADTPRIGCAGTGENIRASVAPRTCSTWYSWVDHAHSHNFEHLRWRSWGGYQASATGVDVYTGMGTVVRSPVHLTVSRPRGFNTVGGHVDNPAYSRMTVRYRDGQRATVSLAWGWDLYPLY